MRDRRFMSQPNKWNSNQTVWFPFFGGVLEPCVEPETSKRIPSLSVFLSSVHTIRQAKSVKRNGFPRLRIGSTSSASSSSSFSISLGLDAAVPRLVIPAAVMMMMNGCPPFGAMTTRWRTDSQNVQICAAHVICQTRRFRWRFTPEVCSLAAGCTQSRRSSVKKQHSVREILRKAISSFFFYWKHADFGCVMGGGRRFHLNNTHSRAHEVLEIKGRGTRGGKDQ